MHFLSRKHQINIKSPKIEYYGKKKNRLDTNEWLI